MLVNAGAAMSGQALAAERRLTIEGVTITARADHIQTASGSIVIQRMKAGRLAKSGETPKARYALLQAMVKRDEGVAASFLHISLLDGSQKNATVGGVERHRCGSVRSEAQRPDLPNLPLLFHLSDRRAARLAGNPLDRFPVSLLALLNLLRR
jgi:hypothetical protein